MRQHVLIALALITTASVAHAGKKEDALKEVEMTVPAYMKYAVQAQWNDSYDLEEVNKLPSCADLVARAKKAGVPDDALIALGPGADKHPKVQKVGGQNKITFADVPWVCDAFEAKKKIEPLAGKIRKAFEYKKNNPSEPTQESVASYSRGAGDSSITSGTQCLTEIDALLASGVPATDQVVIDNKTKVTLDEAKPLCQYQIDHATAFNDRVKEVQDARYAEIAAKYEALGVKGDRLKLFVEYDGVYWRAKKCEIVHDIKQVVKAKYLYHWLQNADYTHTIRKYTFKGNKYKVSEKTYNTEAKAYKGCK